MAAKSYADKIADNWDDLSPEHLFKLQEAWNEYRAELYARRIEQHPPEHRQALYNTMAEQLGDLNDP
jgi:hypothetical protein